MRERISYQLYINAERKIETESQNECQTMIPKINDSLIFNIKKLVRIMLDWKKLVSTCLFQTSPFILLKDTVDL